MASTGFLSIITGWGKVKRLTESRFDKGAASAIIKRN
jgi:hypothetical protein